MGRYIAVGSYNIDLQEGDGGGPNGVCSVDFVVPVAIDMSGKSAKLMVRKSHNDKPIIVKTISNGITITGQNISVEFIPNDTKGHSGLWRWDLEVFTNTSDIITIGRGTLNIISEITTQ